MTSGRRNRSFGISSPAARAIPLPRGLHPAHRKLAPGEVDVLELQVATVGGRVSKATEELFAENSYREYPRASRTFGAARGSACGVLAQPRSSRARHRFGDAPEIGSILKQEYTGERFVRIPSLPGS